MNEENKHHPQSYHQNKAPVATNTALPSIFTLGPAVYACFSLRRKIHGVYLGRWILYFATDAQLVTFLICSSKTNHVFP